MSETSVTIGCACRVEPDEASAEPLECCPFHARLIEHAAGESRRRLRFLTGQVENLIEAWDAGDNGEAEVGALRETLHGWDVEAES